MPEAPLHTPHISHKHTAPNKLGTVLYIHGGGLLFGTPNDLPHPYIQAFNQAGVDVLALDYPLAPQHNVAEILESLEQSIAHLALSSPVILLGRSAGAFLAIQLTARAIQRGTPLADALVSLYGYADMSAPDFAKPSKHYLEFGQVAPHLLTDQAPDPTDFASRYSMYVGHRQKGTWRDTVLGDLPPQTTVIPADIYASFPPTYLAASVYDPDVPYRSSKQLARQLPNSRLQTIYDSPEHDFDRDPNAPTGLPVYRKIITWLREVLPSGA